SLRVLHFPLRRKGGGEIRIRTGAQELVLLDHGGDTDARRRRRRLYANDPRGKTHAHGVRQSDVRREGQGHVDARAARKFPVKGEEHATGADVLRRGKELSERGIGEADGGGQTHVETSHGTAVGRVFEHRAPFSAKSEMHPAHGRLRTGTWATRPETRARRRV